VLQDLGQHSSVVLYTVQRDLVQAQLTNMLQDLGQHSSVVLYTVLRDQVQAQLTNVLQYLL
jgi:hypothetical protein